MVSAQSIHRSSIEILIPYFADRDSAPEQTKREVTNITIPPQAETMKHHQASRPSIISIFTGGQGLHHESRHHESRQMGTPSDTLSQQTLQPARESLSSSSTTTNNKEIVTSDSHSADGATPTASTAPSGSSTTVIQGASMANVSSIIGGSVPQLSHSQSLQQQSGKVQTPRLRFVSSVEFRHSSGETSTTPLSPDSPVEDSSGEKPRLQRSKAQSRKTFRLRRGRQNNHGDNIPIHPSVVLEPEPPVIKTTTTDLSWDSVSQTSSTSGYRDNYSLQTGLLSPDDGSFTTMGRSASQHSLLMLFETQDEDTLI